MREEGIGNIEIGLRVTGVGNIELKLGIDLFGSWGVGTMGGRGFWGGEEGVGELRVDGALVW